MNKQAQVGNQPKGDAVRGKDQINANQPPMNVEDVTLNVSAIEKAQKDKPQVKHDETPQGIVALIAMGIPIRKATFHRTVIFDLGISGGTPEHAYYSPDWGGLEKSKKHKIARMWYTPHGLVAEQQGVWKIVPLANVSDTCV